MDNKTVADLITRAREGFYVPKDEWLPVMEALQAERPAETITLSAPVAQYLLALTMDDTIRSESMNAYARPLLAEALFPGLSEYVATVDAPRLAGEAFRATIWKEVS